jgi:hypothetical protein
MPRPSSDALGGEFSLTDSDAESDNAWAGATSALRPSAGTTEPT